MNIKITADSTCDLSDELINENNVEIFPLYIVKGNGTFKDKLEISTDDIFNYYAQRRSSVPHRLFRNTTTSSVLQLCRKNTMRLFI